MPSTSAALVVLRWGEGAVVAQPACKDCPPSGDSAQLLHSSGSPGGPVVTGPAQDVLLLE